MKKILLATTALGLTAGVAAAQEAPIKFTGTATTGYYSDAGTDYELYNSFELKATASGETGSGLKFGAEASIATGATWDRAGDFEIDGTDTVDAKAKTLGTPKIYVEGEFGKVAIKVNGFKDYQDDSREKYDLEYTHSISGLSIGLRTDLTSENATTKGKSSVKLGYTAGAIALNGAFDEVNGAYGVSAAYTMNALTFTLAGEGSDLVDSEKQSLKVAYKGENGISGSIKGDTKDIVTVTAGYSANGLSVDLEANNKTTGVKNTSNQWKVTGAYDLGGGLSVEAGANGEEDVYLGAKMSF